ncbi:TetR/AcrR family transcriptional regulator [Cupriavidus oxalaticus]|jgi:AcrR family transcriptional regulator|uniref:TetR family transcriptional regulator n=1 Tax=Cupriavidus oxalaticus TaxID=96344 RepID=A0A375GM04_9BURK|nr:TetR/AcrR family transcriptional regulator [Cupriavidus oxalaticus]QEZ43701.1 TetR/AcrR family transcriptional regulator [Cupriavidus oxalaticus]QRQ84893.1 TetR family transcriptional regulator [Cupriavidus oxalaticus]QRQ91018.1 TetR family transcriptional regulator [Cupriavidus oxalaticus]WQD85558.1 TetR/AcrR family transcriptional regulator [Cupriavidus oxalaticus]SPC21693.1 Transcriptional regulator, TetR family [Cupriavidus oxalaticus]
MAKAQTKSDALRDSILEVATRLFIERGFDGTGLNDIADAVGLSRPALYYYFKSKEAILEELTTAVTRTAADLATEAIPEAMRTPSGILRHLVMRHAMLILSHPLQFRVVERNENNLPPKQRKLAEQSRRAVLAQFRQAIESGIDQGKFRVMDAKVAAFSIIGMCNWTAWWFNPSGQVSMGEVARQIADMALGSVELPSSRKLDRAGPAAILQLLRDDLTLLERSLDSSAAGKTGRHE